MYAPYFSLLYTPSLNPSAQTTVLRGEHACDQPKKVVMEMMKCD